MIFFVTVLVHSWPFAGCRGRNGGGRGKAGKLKLIVRNNVQAQFGHDLTEEGKAGPSPPSAVQWHILPGASYSVEARKIDLKRQ